MELLPAITVALLAAMLILLAWQIAAARRGRSTLSSDRIESVLIELKSDIVSQQMEGLLSLRQSLDSANRVLSDRLSEGNSAMEGRLALFGEIENRLGQLAVQTKNIESVGRNIQSLSELLKPPKLRGGLGEVFLENLLGQILPRTLFEMQYRFDDGQRVDAIVKIGDRLLPIDSKFPLESYQRLDDTTDGKRNLKEFTRVLKQQIDSIATKYLRPELGTTDFAIMYIPSEAVYYQLIAGPESDGFEYALSKKIIPSSPGHLYGFLASVSAMYRQAGLQSDSRKLVAGLDGLGESLERLKKLHERMNGSMRSMSGSLAKASEESTGMADRLERMRDPEISTAKEKADNQAAC